MIRTVVLLALVLTFAACKKEQEPTPEPVVEQVEVVRPEEQDPDRRGRRVAARAQEQAAQEQAAQEQAAQEQAQAEQAGSQAEQAAAQVGEEPDPVNPATADQPDQQAAAQAGEQAPAQPQEQPQEQAPAQAEEQAQQQAPGPQIAQAPAQAGPDGSQPVAQAGRPSLRQPEAGAPTLPDLRLLLTINDIKELTSSKVNLRRVPLVGIEPSPKVDSIMYAPVKGNKYGVGLQVFREDSAIFSRDRFNAMLASYPSAVEIAAIAGRTFFAYRDDLLYVGFILPAKNLVFVLSCSRSICNSDSLYELAKKVSSRSTNL
ncbi:MAG TPA: hypothetical protein PK329_08400 [Myxococcota bacterium]|nr:hypothetical protein [Myxococcota bacterium]HOS62427.1 hypothetical protein [Myxococcota bacterium]HPL25945.1 hypothetical protein [Myxococcota bacterium]